MISIIDYGLGNLMAFANIYKKLNIPLKIISDSSQLNEVEKIILPGVGSFDWAMKKLNQSEMIQKIDYLVTVKKIPVLGVCVGMQIMATKSEEGELDGLSWIEASVKKLDQTNNYPLPHMGWNNVNPLSDNCPLFEGLYDQAKFYFLHSYYFKENHTAQAISHTSYDRTFTSAVRNENIYGVQFHPEKSHSWGVRLLKNFALNC